MSDPVRPYRPFGEGSRPSLHHTTAPGVPNAPAGGAWEPPNLTDVHVLPAGRWWDAVRAPQYIGARALALLGEETGAVIEDPRGRRLYWLVPPGTATAWSLQQVAVLAGATYVAVPPRHVRHGGGPHWRVPVSHGRYLTDAPLLHAALRAAITAELGPRPEAAP
ncbi:hypothetical protein [Streptomyces sp. NPDC018031]|uniref:hypothetical protein n=1 Tax=Streptomyces sp. NPDC018031 TaxID=3365033 RepID=UPI0037B16DEC